MAEVKQAEKPDLIRCFLLEYDRWLTSGSGLTYEQWLDQNIDRIRSDAGIAEPLKGTS